MSEPAWRRAHVHLVGIGGSGMGALARLLLDMGKQVSGSDLRASADHRVAGASRRDDRGWARRGQRRGRRLRRALGGRARRQSRGRRGGAARAPRHEAGRGSRRADGRPHRRGGRRHAWQDDHDRARHVAAGVRRTRPAGADRRRYAWLRARRSTRRRTDGGRGRRVRPPLSQLLARGGGGHQHRSRSPRLLRRPGRDPCGVSAAGGQAAAAGSIGGVRRRAVRREPHARRPAARPTGFRKASIGG